MTSASWSPSSSFLSVCMLLHRPGGLCSVGGYPFGGSFPPSEIPPAGYHPPPGVTAVASVALSQQRQHTAKPLMFCVWCSRALVLARPFGSGDSVTPGLSMHRVPAASENPDGSRRLNALSFEWPGRLNHGAEFSTPRPRGFSAPMVFSYLTMNVANLLKRRPPRAAHDKSTKPRTGTR